MKRTVNKSEFRDAFRDYGRDGNFSYEGLGALFNHLEEYEDDTGEELELDVIGLCCDFSEHDSAMKAIEDLGYDYSPEGDNDEEREESALDWLRDQTTVIEIPRRRGLDEKYVGGGVIIQGF